MKNLLFILLLGLGFSQTEITTKKFEVPSSLFMGSVGDGIILNDYFGFEGMSVVQIYWDIDCGVDITFNCEGTLNSLNLSGSGISSHTNSLTCFDSGFYGEGAKLSSYTPFTNAPYNSCYFPDEITLFVTAEFPIEDTGYIEEGFEFCVHPGANLVSYPCDNPVSIEDALPDGVENYITSIIGEGLAAIYLPTGDWVGGLVELQPGSGYWFKSNSNLCFEYDCVAD